MMRESRESVLLAYLDDDEKQNIYFVYYFVL